MKNNLEKLHLKLIVFKIVSKLIISKTINLTLHQQNY